MKSKRGVVLKIERKSNDYDYKGCPELFQWTVGAKKKAQADKDRSPKVPRMNL